MQAETYLAVHECIRQAALGRCMGPSSGGMSSRGGRPAAAAQEAGCVLKALAARPQAGEQAAPGTGQAGLDHSPAACRTSPAGRPARQGRRQVRSGKGRRAGGGEFSTTIALRAAGRTVRFHFLPHGLCTAARLCGPARVGYASRCGAYQAPRGCAALKTYVEIDLARHVDSNALASLETGKRSLRRPALGSAGGWAVLLRALVLAAACRKV